MFCDFEFRYQHGEAKDVFQLSLKLQHRLSKSNKRILTSCKLQVPVLTILIHGNIHCIFLLEQFFPLVLPCRVKKKKRMKVEACILRLEITRI